MSIIACLAFVPLRKGFCLSFLFLVVVFAAHLMCVNVASAGPLVAAGLDWLEGRGSRLAGEAGRYLAAWGAALLLPGGMLGIVVGWHFWDDRYQQVLGRLSSKLHFGAWEIVFSLVLMVAQVWWWRARPGAKGWERRGRIFIAVLASTNLLYHFPMLFAVIETTATSGATGGDAITGREFRAIIADQAILSRALHFVLAAVAMCGIMLLGYALRLARRKADPSDVQQVAAWGGQVALVPSLLQVPVGMWLTVSLTRTLQSAVTGADLLATCLLISSVVLAIWMLQTLAAIAIGDAERSKLVRAMALMVVIITLMSGTLQRLRALGEAKHAEPAPQSRTTTDLSLNA